MQQWKTQERITLNLNRITFGNVTACNLDFYRRSAVKGFIPLEKCAGREKLLMLMDFWKLQGLRKLCPLSLLSYALLSITLAIKIAPPPLPPSFPPSLYCHKRPSGFSTSPFGFSTSCPALFFLPGHVWPTFEPLPESVCCFTSTCSFLATLTVTSGFKVFCLLSQKCSPGVKVSKTGLVCHPCLTWCSLQNSICQVKKNSRSKPLEIQHKFTDKLKVKSRKSVYK